MDGVHLLRTRRHTRLWYRTIPATPQLHIEPPVMTSGTDLLVHIATVAEEAAWEELLAEPLPELVAVQPVIPAPVVVAPVAKVAPIVKTAPVVLAAPVAKTVVEPAPVVFAPVVPVAVRDEPVRQTKRLGQPQSAVQETVTPIAAAVIPDGPADDWRVVPETAPSLLLSATDLLDARTPGPVLRPGCRYRIAGVQNGIVGLYVTEPDGQTGLGFCAAVDLICIDGRFQRYRAGRTPNVSKNPLRSRVNRFTGGLSQATTSLLGAAASHGSR